MRPSNAFERFSFTIKDNLFPQTVLVKRTETLNNSCDVITRKASQTERAPQYVFIYFFSIVGHLVNLPKQSPTICIFSFCLYCGASGKASQTERTPQYAFFVLVVWGLW